MLLGIDIGTTTISFVIVDEKDGEVKKSFNKLNSSFVKEGVQNPNVIIDICLKTTKEIIKEYEIKRIGISNQMHGMLYIDSDGNVLSNFYTWQNQKGNEKHNDTTYVKESSYFSNYPLSTGFGSVSYYVDAKKGEVPKNAKKIFTIGDYLAIKLTGNINVEMHTSNAASFGLFDIKNGSFDTKAIQLLGLDENMYPNVSSDIKIVGNLIIDGEKYNTIVTSAVGDNQCATYAVAKDSGSLIINYGTGSQISYITDKYLDRGEDYEVRPFVDGKYLVVGCALAGGYSLQLLRDFFGSLFEDEGKINYALIDNLVVDVNSSNGIKFDTRFLGTRNNSDIKASITGIDNVNFKAKYVIYALFEGMVTELHDIFRQFEKCTDVKYFTGTGNGLIKNKKLISLVEEKFGRRITLSNVKEEAGYGAAKLSLLAK